ncbi:MAG TPA: DUF1667 domain-containing protein [Bacillota bacterium]|nr:DUF1667 domain-containing protein [Bacillota bacterium]HQC36001.1 DUF1667 domain-containing protein [Bacillota bacterium]
MEERKMTCIMCPRGCLMTAKIENGEMLSLEGNTCKRGYEYAYNEIHHPVRTLTTTVRTEGGRIAAVKSSVPVPKKLQFEIMKQINALRPSDDIVFGQTLIQNVCSTGSDIIVTSD